MTEQDVVWRERLAKGLAYLGQAREVGSSDGRHASALQVRLAHEAQRNAKQHIDLFIECILSIRVLHVF
jgi:hypothetical protein